MPHVLRVPSEVTLAALQSALAGVRARQVAVVVPPGRPSRLGSAETMRDLQSYAAGLGKDLVVIGGDEHLRAVAVAAGFAAATSLDEWEETQPQLRAVTARGGVTGPLWELTDLAVVSDDWFAVSLPGALDFPYTDEPPPYVQELLTANVGEMEAEGELALDPDARGADAPDGMGMDNDGLDTVEHEALALRNAHEHYEEQLTAAIRESGGVSRPLRFEIRRLTRHEDEGSPSDGHGHGHDGGPPVEGDEERDDSPAI